MTEKKTTIGVKEKTRHKLAIIGAKEKIPIGKLVDDLVKEKYGDDSEDE